MTAVIGHQVTENLARAVADLADQCLGDVRPRPAQRLADELQRLALVLQRPDARRGRSQRALQAAQLRNLRFGLGLRLHEQRQLPAQGPHSLLQRLRLLCGGGIGRRVKRRHRRLIGRGQLRGRCLHLGQGRRRRLGSGLARGQTVRLTLVAQHCLIGLAVGVQGRGHPIQRLFQIAECGQRRLMGGQVGLGHG